MPPPPKGRPTPPPTWTLYARNLPGWQRAAAERAREAGGQRSLRQWVTDHFNDALEPWRDDA